MLRKKNYICRTCAFLSLLCVEVRGRSPPLASEAPEGRRRPSCTRRQISNFIRFIFFPQVHWKEQPAKPAGIYKVVRQQPEDSERRPEPAERYCFFLRANDELMMFLAWMLSTIISQPMSCYYPLVKCSVLHQICCFSLSLVWKEMKSGGNNRLKCRPDKLSSLWLHQEGSFHNYHPAFLQHT